MKEEVEKEILNCWMLNEWISPIHMILKKSGVTVVKNEKNELIPTRTIIRWHMCVDYRRLNSATRKDYFPFPLLIKCLKVWLSILVFVNWMVHQISIHPLDQQKTTCTSPYDIFDHKRMSFGLYNALAIFYDLLENIVDDFFIYGNKFNDYLLNLTKVFKKLSPLINSKAIRSFLRHVSFYKCFIKDFSKITSLMSNLLVKDVLFNFDSMLKEVLISAPILQLPDWNSPFEVVCNASDFVVGVVLGQRRDNKVYSIYYASKTVDEAQANYATIEKELLEMVYAFEKFSDGSFPNEQLLVVSIKKDLWYVDIVNYLASRVLPPNLSY
ncbi:Retrovirus-related Pol polyprotein from transposon 17.6, partial [Mucuna pruriens]